MYTALTHGTNGRLFFISTIKNDNNNFIVSTIIFIVMIILTVITVTAITRTPIKKIKSDNMNRKNNSNNDDRVVKTKRNALTQL